MDEPVRGLDWFWVGLRNRAGLPDLRIHDLRHSFASVGLAGGQGLPIIGRLLGHQHVQTTARYAHLAEDPVRAATDQIAGDIASRWAAMAARNHPTHDATRAYRRRRLLEAATTGRLTRIAGVAICLRPRDFDLAVWRPAQVLGVEPVEDGAPCPTFPWTLPEERTRLSSHAGMVEARAGDTVLVDVVELVRVETQFREFDHPDDGQKLVAGLKVYRSDGSLDRVGGTLRYSRAAATLDAAFSADADRRVVNELVGRLESALGIHDLHDLIEDAYANPSKALPLERIELPEHVEAVMALYRAFGGIPEAYATFAYQMGRAEARTRVLPRAISAQDGVRLGGEVGGGTNRARARRWQAHAFEIARALRERSHGLSGLALARAVLEHWHDGPAPMPSPPGSERYLAQCLLNEFGRGA
jgi:hypothetical protein